MKTKKLLAFVMASAMVLSMAACGGSSSSGNSGIQREGAGVGEAVQNLLTLAESLDSKAVILLIQEEAGLLAILHIYHIADTIFNDFNLGIKRFADEAFHTLHALL